MSTCSIGALPSGFREICSEIELNVQMCSTTKSDVCMRACRTGTSHHRREVLFLEDALMWIFCLLTCFLAPTPSQELDEQSTSGHQCPCGLIASERRNAALDPCEITSDTTGAVPCVPTQILSQQHGFSLRMFASQAGGAAQTRRDFLHCPFVDRVCHPGC